MVHIFFFSSRRRHTRFDCDWSSDVCSSDLPLARECGWNRLSTISTRVPTAAGREPSLGDWVARQVPATSAIARAAPHRSTRSEEHTSELQSQSNLVCRLLLENKNRLCIVYI